VLQELQSDDDCLCRAKSSCYSDFGMIPTHGFGNTRTWWV